MKRRDALKALTTAGTGVILGWDGTPAKDTAGEVAAKPVRALRRENGQLWQPIHISMPDAIPDGAVVKVDGAAYSHEPLRGTRTQIEILVPRVESERKAIVTVEGAGAANSATVILKPVREMLVYVLP